MDKEGIVLIYNGILLSHKKNTTMPFAAIKRTEHLPFLATGMDLEDIMLSEISQTEKDKYCMISLICRP